MMSSLRKAEIHKETVPSSCTHEMVLVVQTERHCSPREDVRVVGKMSGRRCNKGTGLKRKGWGAKR